MLIIFAAAFLLVAVLYIYAIAPDNNRDMSPFHHWYYAHRGLHNLEKGIPENTLPAFQKAIEGKYGIELDVHLSADQHVIVFHDDDLKRACSVKKRVCDLTYEELKKYELFSTNQQIPLLSDVLDLISGKVPLIIELKSCTDYKKLCVILANLLSGYEGLYCIKSFDPRIVKWFRLNQPNILRGQLSASLYKEPNKLSLVYKYAISFLLTNFMTRPQFISYKHVDKKNLSFVICRKLLKANTVAWTIRSREELQDAADLYDLVVFESFNP